MLIYVHTTDSWGLEITPSNNMWRPFRVAFGREFEVPLTMRLR